MNLYARYGKEINMALIKRPFAIHRVESWYSDNTYETLEKAQEAARKEAYTGAEDYYIYKAIAIAEKPARVNDVVIKDV
jgi:hypothetical protein